MRETIEILLDIINDLRGQILILKYENESLKEKKLLKR